MAHVSFSLPLCKLRENIRMPEIHWPGTNLNLLQDLKDTEWGQRGSHSVVLAGYEFTMEHGLVLKLQQSPCLSLLSFWNIDRHEPLQLEKVNDFSE